MEYRSLFQEIHSRPQMYGMDGSFAQHVAFLHGVDAGNDWQLLTGFREWLIVQLDMGGNLSWPGLVLHAAFPGRDHIHLAALSDPEHNRATVDTLFTLLDQFIAQRSEPGATLRIFEQYLRWSQSRHVT